MSIITETEVIARVDSLTVKRLELYIAEGWVAPKSEGSTRGFKDIDIARLQLIEQLREDMALGDEAVPVVLSLIDQIHGLRHQLKAMGRAVEAQGEDVRRAVLTAFQAAVKDGPTSPDKS